MLTRARTLSPIPNGADFGAVTNKISGGVFRPCHSSGVAINSPLQSTLITRRTLMGGNFVLFSSLGSMFALDFFNSPSCANSFKICFMTFFSGPSTPKAFAISRRDVRFGLACIHSTISSLFRELFIGCTLQEGPLWPEFNHTTVNFFFAYIIITHISRAHGPHHSSFQHRPHDYFRQSCGYLPKNLQWTSERP